ncbi:MAG: hypothetical protein RL154_1052 [Pseudomonadota bacterium]|jgi:hypothetical protein
MENISSLVSTVFSLSIFEIVLIVLIALIIASELGYFIGYNLSRLISKITGKPFEIGIDDNVATITNSALALLGLFLGFAFSSALDHFEKNREFVISEASAISTVYRFTNIIDDQYKLNMQKHLQEYTKIRLQFDSGNVDNKDIKAIDNESQQQMRIIWQDTKGWIVASPDWAYNDTFIQAVNAMAVIEEERVQNMLNEVPRGFFIPIALFLLFNGILMGISLGETAKRHVILSWGMYLLIALSVGIIVDLDRPLKGYINVDQGAIEDLYQKMTLKQQ